MGDVIAFCLFLGGLTGAHYSTPSRVSQELACRAAGWVDPGS